MSIHGMAAAFFSAPEWNLSEDEARQVVKAAAAVQKLHPLPLVPPEWLVYGQAAMVVAGVYGPRLAMAWRRRRAPPSDVPADPTLATGGLPFGSLDGMRPPFLHPQGNGGNASAGAH